MLFLVLGLCGKAAAQDMEITGKVTAAEDGTGLPGVNILVVGTSSGAITDINGSYKIKAASGSVLQFRFLGYTTEERTVGASGSLDVVMKEEVKALKEAVVIGYGSLSKKDLTGSLATVNSKDFQTGTVVSAEQQIAGKIAGVQITNNGGAPGGGATIRIRGGASLRASNDPLYVIDGVPVDNGGIAGSRNILGMINPNDIETFTVLKDASATAIYGSRGSNGVIIITTKKGTGKPTFSLTTSNAISFITRQTEVLSGDQVRAIVNDTNGLATDAQRKLLGTANTDWQKQLFQPAFVGDYNLSYGGKYKDLPFRVSLGYLRQDGILKSDQTNRGSLAINLNPTLLDGDLKFNVQLKGSVATNNFANTGAIGAAVGYDPTQPIYEVDSNGVRSQRFGGYREWLGPNGTVNNIAPQNPLGILNLYSNRSTVYRTLSNFEVNYGNKLIPGLRANLNLGIDAATGSGTEKVPDSAYSNYNNRGFTNKYGQDKRTTVLDFYLNYQKSLEKLKSRVDLMAGYSYQDFYYYNPNYRRKTFRGDTSAAYAKPKFDFDEPQNKLISYYGRAIFSIREIILLQGTIRTDGSSRFSPDNRWGVFPSASVGLALHELPGIKKIKAIENLKIRASWGQTGQQDIGENYSYLPLYALSNNTAMYQFGNEFYNMYRPNRYDAKIQWESTTTYNAGLDFGLFKGRVFGSVDVYTKETTDLLNEIPVAAGTNFADRLVTNVGSVENSGVEIALNFVPIQTEKMEWSFGVNGTWNNNKITKLNNVFDSTFIGVETGGISGGGIGRNIQINTVGYPLNSFYVYKQVYENGKPVEGVYEDLNGDGVVNDKDRYHYKSPVPKYFFGFNSSFRYKQFSVGFVMRANLDNYVFNNVYSERGVYNNITINQQFLNNASDNVLETEFTGNLPAPVDNSKRFSSDYYVTNASFLRMDNLNFGYDFGFVVPNRLKIGVSLNIQNVFVITNYKGIDPEHGGGIDNNIYPRPRTFTIGANFAFQ